MQLRSANAVALKKQMSPPKSSKGDRTGKSKNREEKSPKLPPITVKQANERLFNRGKKGSVKTILAPSPKRDETPEH
jgi:hypothetical protein